MPRKQGKVPSGIPTNEPSMVARSHLPAGKHYPQQHTYGGYPSNNNESGDQVLFRSDGFDGQHSRYYNQTNQIISQSNKFSSGQQQLPQGGNPQRQP